MLISNVVLIDLTEQVVFKMMFIRIIKEDKKD